MKRFLLIITISIFLLMGFWQGVKALETIVDYPTIPGAESPEEMTEADLPKIINYIYRFALGAVGIVALIAMLIGALSYVFSAGNTSKMADAKDQITSAILGVIILLASVLILRTINPDLVKFNLSLPPIAHPGPGCCICCCYAPGTPPCDPVISATNKGEDYEFYAEAIQACPRDCKLGCEAIGALSGFSFSSNSKLTEGTCGGGEMGYACYACDAGVVGMGGVAWCDPYKPANWMWCRAGITKEQADIDCAKTADDCCKSTYVVPFKKVVQETCK